MSPASTFVLSISVRTWLISKVWVGDVSRVILCILFIFRMDMYSCLLFGKFCLEWNHEYCTKIDVILCIIDASSNLLVFFIWYTNCLPDIKCYICKLWNALFLSREIYRGVDRNARERLNWNIRRSEFLILWLNERRGGWHFSIWKQKEQLCHNYIKAETQQWRDGETGRLISSLSNKE